MYSLNNFSLTDMTECGIALRKLGLSANSMESTAQKIVRFFYDSFRDPVSGDSAFALARFFKTHSYGELAEDLQYQAQRIIQDETVPTDLKCLTLLGTIGDRQEWCDRTCSQGHQVIPLPSEQMVSQAPMISQLIQQLGLTIKSVIAPSPDMIVDLKERTYNVFYIATAPGSPYIPAQEDFVHPYGIQSVLGFGGTLPSGNLMAIILFSKVPIQRETAELFKPLALNAKMAVLAFDQGKVFQLVP
jgi:hypothetical protein